MSLSRYALLAISGLSMSLLCADAPQGAPSAATPQASRPPEPVQAPPESSQAQNPSTTQTPALNSSSQAPAPTIKPDSSLSEATPSVPAAAIKAASLSISRPSAVKYVQTTGSRVRMRVAPQLDAPVVRELDKSVPLEVTGETDDFYAVRPPYPLKAYVFRTYILDEKIEGDRVNVRLEPSPQGTIVTQLSTGAPAVGTPSLKNPKWLEIDLPPSVRFYISRDYASAIDNGKYHELLQAFDAQTQKAASEPKVQEKPAVEPTTTAQAAPTLNKWQQKELELEKKWFKEHPGLTAQDYTIYQSSQAKELQGQLELYAAPEFAPGDFIICQGERIAAIVYSAKVNLSQYKDTNVIVQVAPRDNQGFAYPTYCVLSIERVSE